MGFQFLHSALQGIFQNITYTCEGTVNCTRDCNDPFLSCYLVDNHGYIVAADKDKQAARFLGEVQSDVMRSLIQRGIYNKITIYDYQAVCFDPTGETNDGSILLTVCRQYYNYYNTPFYTFSVRKETFKNIKIDLYQRDEILEGVYWIKYCKKLLGDLILISCCKNWIE